ncbi:DNA-directed RNA polymerase subunit delta [Bacillus sp. 165]|uniref:DNA-directed RNA polymerase subunit delta n=1 Tax=Bacillus sp. 165 TaxID=1529117 RepID=UPI001ADC1BE5|nr:DNA-directed RNA polymerase subunit delta [Bacillus sp. 165]MBO9130105.1 DNA-directed RNA polymerase subunit delta [Bacillus sp. 165]
MKLEQYSPEELKELSMIELAHAIMENRKQAITFSDVVSEVANILGLSEEQVVDKLSQFYTDLNIDGRFICIGEGRWGLRSWYPYEQIEEEVLPQPKPKKKRKASEEDMDEFVAEEEEDYDDLEDIDEIEDLDEEDLDDDEAEDFDDLDDEDDIEDLDDEDEDYIEEDEVEYDETEEDEEA